MAEPSAPEIQQTGNQQLETGDAVAHTSTKSITSSSDTQGSVVSRGAGRWGEQAPEEVVDVDEALTEFEELRNELSRAQLTRTQSRVSRVTSLRAPSKATADEEEAGETPDFGLVDLEEWIRRDVREGEEAGILPKKVGVSFKNLTVQGFGSGSVPVRTFPQEVLGGFGWDLIQALLGKIRNVSPPVKDIIKDFSGVVKPGEMLLVLGKPGSGSSTFLRALTNQRRDFTNIKGDVHYSGLDFELAKGKFRGEIMYNGEEDLHLPTLTVEQTLRFALKTKTPRTRLPGVGRGKFVDDMLSLYTKMFAMGHVLKTMVGNQFIRGVSGGERKRVSIMEALASRATVNSFDNSTRGLDSSTAVDYIRSLRILTNLTKSTTIVTLYQAGEAIYEAFDKVCLIQEGRQIYYGPSSEARAYFESLGFEPQPRSTTADFLSMLTDPTTRRIRKDAEIDKVPLTAEALESAFRNSKYWAAVQKELAEYDVEIQESGCRDAEGFSQAVINDKSRRTQSGSPYIVSFPRQVWYLVQREVQLQLQDYVALRTKFINTVIMSLIIGSLFYDIPHTSEGSFFIGGVLFFNNIILAWSQLFEAISMAMGRQIVAKQTTFAFYRPSALVLAKTIADFPVMVPQVFIFSLVLYFMAGLVVDAGKFWINYLFVLTTVVTFTAFYRSIGSWSKDVPVAIRLAFTGLNVMGLFAGYMISFGSMKSWVYKWIYYANPLTYAQEAVMINQFAGLDLDCSPSQLIPSIPGASVENQVCTLPGATAMSSKVSGTAYIQARFGYEPSHLWRNFGIIIAFFVGYLAIAMLGVEFANFGGGGASTKVFAKSSKTPAKDASSPSSSDNEKLDHEGADGGDVSPLKTMATSVKTNGSVYTWRNVNYTVGSGATEKQLLHDINGFVKPGRITALMGASGAGKTTLLDNLAQRKRVGIVGGEFLMNGKPLKVDFERSTAFVEQQDVHDGTATVREALQFSAMLRQPASVSKEEKYAFVEQIIRLLELESLADAIIGFPGFGLSVEERKRVTIGVELAANPSELLFLDEPTSGLDSNGAISIVRFLRKLADESNIAILCTIHQPSSVLFQNFDDLLLLARGGREVYFGPIGTGGSTVINYFEKNGAVPAHVDANPAEYILDTVRTKPGRKPWYQIWDESPEAKNALDEIEALVIERQDIPENRELRTLEFAMPLSTQIAEVTKRVWTHYWRDASYGFSKIYSNLSMALISGTLFVNAGSSVLDMQSRGFAVFTVLILSPMLIVAVQPKFLELRTLYETRERNSKIYSATAWITAMAIVEIPYAILGSVVFFLPWYYMIGLPTSSTQAGYEFFLIMLFQIFIPYMAMWIAAMCPDLVIVNVCNPFLFLVEMGFCGILVTFDGQSTFYSSWLYWANPLTWLVKGLLGNILHGVEVICADNELVSFAPPSNQTCGEYAGDWLNSAFGYIVDLDASDMCQYCQFSSGDEYLQTVNINYLNRWRDLGIFVIYIFSNLFLVYALYWAFREYRWSRLFSRFSKN